jgi:pyruvate-formate lyase-activating enzyme
MSDIDKAKQDIPHPNTFCGNGYKDWLEVNLTPDCNASCSWCVERRGWHPVYRAPWEDIVAAAHDVGRKNIILLGGEPTLYPRLGDVIETLALLGHDVWITTNGSTLTEEFVKRHLKWLHGINVSIHSYDMDYNYLITGVPIVERTLYGAFEALAERRIGIRLNCNCILGFIDSPDEITAYLRWARDGMGVTSVRFAELKHDAGAFVDLASILDHQYGLNDDPYICGCTHDAVIEGVNVNFRQMCGMQTELRPCPSHPVIQPHPVLYYDGKLYDGWQQQEGREMRKEEMEKVLWQVKQGTITIAKAMEILRNAERERRLRAERTGGNCQY